jgi:hypothetical protein
MGIVDGFIYPWSYYNQRQGYGKSITKEHLNEIISKILNKQHLWGIDCLREEMVHDTGLEEAYTLVEFFIYKHL